MSGGAFDYDQYRIDQIADKIEHLIEKNGREKTKEELKDEGWRPSNGWRADDWYEKYPEDKFHYKYPDEVIEKFKEGLDVLKKAAIYAHRIDYLISGDDGDETFIERLKYDLEKLNK
jgi:hypothetical protein